MPPYHDLGLATLARGKIDLDNAVIEIGHNAGPRIREYAARFGLVPPLNWCAVSVCTWMAEACEELKIEPPIKGSPAAQGVMGQLMHAGLFTKKKKLADKPEVITPGNLIIWSRPPEDWMGHIGIIDSVNKVGPDWFNWSTKVLEGNSGKRGDRVAIMDRHMNNPRLLGIGRLRSDEPPDTLTSEELKMAHRLMKLSAEVIHGKGEDPMSIIEEMWEDMMSRQAKNHE